MSDSATPAPAAGCVGVAGADGYENSVRTPRGAPSPAHTGTHGSPATPAPPAPPVPAPPPTGAPRLGGGAAAHATPLAGGLAVLVGVLVLAGWSLDSEALKRILPGLVAMNPLAATAFILAGMALGVLADEHADPRARRLAQVGAALVALIGLLKLVAVGGGPELGLDRLLFATKLAADPTQLPNRMAPNTALNFLLVGGALLLLDRRTRRGYWPGQAAIALAGVASLLPALGYAYGLRAFYGVGAFIPMALHAALTFLVLVVGLLSARPGRGLVAIVGSASAGGVMARRLLPAPLLLPAALGWLVLQGQRRGLYDSALSVALFAVTAMLGLALVVGWNARLLHLADAARARLEAERLATHRALEARTRELEAKTREQEAFLYTVAHDLRAPLLSMQGLANILVEDYAPRLGDGCEYLERIVANAEKLQALLDELLALARVGRVDNDLEPVALDNVVADVCAQLQHTLTARGARVDVAGPLPTVRANRVRMVQLFANLIANAVHYTPPERAPAVCIAAAPHADGWELTVADNGVGIPAAYRDRVLGLFQRLPAGKALNPGGTGAGLAIVARIVDTHGGALWFDAAEGGGTTFHLTLPRAASAAALPDPPTAAVIARPTTPREGIPV